MSNITYYITDYDESCSIWGSEPLGKRSSWRASDPLGERTSWRAVRTRTSLRVNLLEGLVESGTSWTQVNYPV